MIYTVSITKKGQMTLPKKVRDDLELDVPGKVIVKVDSKGRLELGKPVPLRDIKKIIGKPGGREFLTEREKIIIPQVMKSRWYRQYVKDTNRH